MDINLKEVFGKFVGRDVARSGTPPYGHDRYDETLQEIESLAKEHGLSTAVFEEGDPYSCISGSDSKRLIVEVIDNGKYEYKVADNFRLG